jgi:hypothetical protein
MPAGRNYPLVLVLLLRNSQPLRGEGDFGSLWHMPRVNCKIFEQTNILMVYMFIYFMCIQILTKIRQCGMSRLKKLVFYKAFLEVTNFFFVAHVTKLMIFPF